MFYKLSVAGIERDLILCPISDSINIAAFILFGDVELTEKCAEALTAGQQPLSLTNIEDESERDIPVDSHEEQVADRLALRQVMERLSGEDRYLLEYRYFLNKTQVETAKQLGISQVQVSRREKKLLLQLRALLI